MSKREKQMLELRELRNAAKSLLRDDVAFLKGENGGQGVAPRLMSSASGKARDAAGSAAQTAQDNKLKVGTGIALGIGAFAAWIFRDRIEKVVDEAMQFILDEGDAAHADDSTASPDATDQTLSE